MLRRKKISILILSSLLLLNPIFNESKIQTVYATNNQQTNVNSFYEININDYLNYNKLITQITAQNNKQGIEYLRIISKWKTYNPLTIEKQEDIKNFIDITKEYFSFINSFEDTKYIKDIKNNYNYYIKDLENLINNPSLFESNTNITYLEYMTSYSNLKIVYNDYSNFKVNAIDKFLSEIIYKNDIKVALKQLQDSNTKKEGINTINKYINTLEEVKKNTNNAPTIRNLATYLISHYKSIINNGKSSYTDNLIQSEKNRVEGLFDLNNQIYKINEYNSYKLLFDNFNEYINLDIMKSKSSKEINKQIQLLIDTPVYSEELIDIKSKQYNFLYKLNNYKNDSLELEKTYNELSLAVTNMQYYNELFNIRYNGLTSNIINNEIQNFNENMQSIDSNVELLKYTREVIKDNNSYRLLKEYSNININIFKILPIIFVLVALVILLFIINKSKKSKDSYKNYYDNYYNDDYYNGNNY